MSETPASALTADEALRRSGFTEYRKKALTPISDITFPPGTVFQTPEGLRAEDEEVRAAFDVQGGIYPIRESVFKASYELPDAARTQPEQPVQTLDAAWKAAEEALPEGWRPITIRPDDDWQPRESDWPIESRWHAATCSLAMFDGETDADDQQEQGSGPTPAAALQALAEKLRSSNG